jgi:hypothetical protein
MNEQLTEQPSPTRRLTDTALIIIAVAAIASWVWRRLRRPTISEVAPEQTDAQALDDKVGGAVGFPPNNAPV